jgi:hypothetical protein
VLTALGDYIREIAGPDELAYAAAELLGRTLHVSRAGVLDAGTHCFRNPSTSRNWRESANPSGRRLARKFCHLQASNV